jgi:Tripartite tricarboxylate transporter family receptor
LGVRSLPELVALAKAKPGAINYGSAGIGTATHLAGAYFALRTGTDLVHVPYTVSSTIIADLLGGRIQATFAPAAFTLPLLQDGRLLALAVAADEPRQHAGRIRYFCTESEAWDDRPDTGRGPGTTSCALRKTTPATARPIDSLFLFCSLVAGLTALRLRRDRPG